MAFRQHHDRGIGKADLKVPIAAHNRHGAFNI